MQCQYCSVVCRLKVDTENFRKKNFDAKQVVVDETSPDLDLWVYINHSSGKLSLYPGKKENILKPDGWLIEKKTTAAQLLLKQKFPLDDGLEDTSIIGPLVSPAFSEFV